MSDLELLVRTIDDDPDPLHNDFSPSVLKLSELGTPAAKAVIDLLNAPDLLTRMRAQRVIEGVIMRRYGWAPGQGYPDPHEGQNQTRILLEENGNYRADAPEQERKAAIEKWRRWLDEYE